MTSVIITVFEQLRTLRVLLECLEDQDFSGEWEVLITDDGSPTETLPLIRTFTKRDALSVRYVWQDNRGFRVAAARNNAIRLAKGDILVFLDAGMLVDRDFLRRHTSFHSIDRLFVCGTRSFALVGEQEDLSGLYKSGKLRVIRAPESTRQQSIAGTPTAWLALLGCNFSVRRRPEVIFDEGFVGWGYEDHEFAYRLAHDNGYRVVVSSEVDAIHVSPKKGGDTWQPLRGQATEESIISLCRNVLYFADLHPSADLEPANALLRKFHLDPVTDRWFRDPAMSDSELTIGSVREWFVRNNVTFATTTAHGEIVRPSPEANSLQSSANRMTSWRPLLTGVMADKAWDLIGRLCRDDSCA